MSDYLAELQGLEQESDFLIALDSDGCVFDSMEIKQKECFCPSFIRHYELQQVSKYARQTWEFVNLYSKTRGCNRFLAVITALDLLRDRPEVQARNAAIPELPRLRQWIGQFSRHAGLMLGFGLAFAPVHPFSQVIGFGLPFSFLTLVLLLLPVQPRLLSGMIGLVLAVCRTLSSDFLTVGSPAIGIGSNTGRAGPASPTTDGAGE